MSLVAALAGVPMLVVAPGAVAAASYQGEADGHAYVQLTGTGQSVQ